MENETKAEKTTEKTKRATNGKTVAKYLQEYTDNVIGQYKADMNEIIQSFMESSDNRQSILENTIDTLKETITRINDDNKLMQVTIRKMYSDLEKAGYSSAFGIRKEVNRLIKEWNAYKQVSDDRSCVECHFESERNSLDNLHFYPNISKYEMLRGFISLYDDIRKADTMEKVNAVVEDWESTYNIYIGIYEGKE